MEVKKKGWETKVPHTYVIICSMIFLAFLATYLIPAGVYDRVKDPVTGRMLVDVNTFKIVPQTPVKFFSFKDSNLFTSIIEGLKQSAGIVFFTFLVCGSFNIIQKTGAIDAAVAKIALKVKDTSIVIIPLLVFIFSIGGVTMGMAAEAIPFIPLGVMLARAVGYDAIVGMTMIGLGAGCGFVGGFVNPFTVGLAQSIAQLPIYSGMTYRVIVYFVIYLSTCIYIMRYAKMIKENPEKSLVRDLEIKEKTNFDFSSLPEFTLSHKLVLLTFFVGFSVIIYGVLKYQWDIEQLSAAFLAMAVMATIVSRTSPSQAARDFLEGAASVVFGALVVGFGRAILIILQQGQIIDPILYYVSTYISKLPSYIAVLLMYISQVLTNTLIPSGTGQAAATMPIMAPLSDMLGISRQTAVLAFQYGDGFTSYIIPTGSSIMSYLAVAKIPYDKWLKWMGPLMGIWLTIGAIAVLIAHAIGY